MAERVVSWQALANFSSIAKEAKRARDELRKLRLEQAALDAQNRSGAASAAAPGTAKAAQATTAAGNAAQDAARKTQSLNDAQRDQVRSAREAENAARGTAAGYDAISRTAGRLSAQQRQIDSSSRGVAAGLQRVSSEARNSSSTLNSTSSSMTGYARRARETETASDGAGRGVGRLRSSLGALSPQIKRDQVTILGLARAMTLLAVPAVLSFINAVAASLPALTAGFIGLAGALAPAIGLLGALPGVLAAAAGGFGTIIAGFAGIGGALKAYATQQKTAAKTSATSARAAQADANRRVGAARKQRKANAAVADAEQKQADVARDNARRIADARRGVADARRREADVAVQSARQIASAQRGVADAQRNERDAERDITDARKRAREQIEQLRRSLRDLRLEEEGASLSIEEAKLRLQRALNDPASTDLERREAQFNVKEAEARLGDVRDEKKATDKQLKEANKKGVEGSDEVVAAKRREADAHRAVIDAERNLKETRVDAARAAQDAARGTADAQRSLQDAYRTSARATRDANQALDDAKTGVGDLGDIMKTSTIPAVNQFREAMRKLTPEARAVVMQLIAMKPLIDKIRATAQKGLLPGVLVFLKESVKLFPLFNSFVGTVAQRFGDLFASIGRAMTTQAAMTSWKKILDSTARVIDSFTDAGENMIFVLGDILEAGGPLTEWLAETVEGWTASWRAMTEGEAGQKRLTAFFEDARKVASQLGRIVAKTSNALFNMGVAFRPVGQFILDGIEKLVTRWSDWTESIEGQSALKDWADQAIVTLGLMGDILFGIVNAFKELGDNVDIDNLLITIRDQLVPALQKLLGVFTGELLNNLVIIASNIANIVAAFGPEGQGALGAFTDALVLITGAMANILKYKLAVGILTALLTALAVKKVVGVVGTVTGVNNIIKSAQTVSKKNKRGGGLAQGRGRAGRAAGNVGAFAATSLGVGGFVPGGAAGGRRKARPGQARRAAPVPPTRARRVVAAAGRPVQAAAGSVVGAARQAGQKGQQVGASIVSGVARGLSPKAALTAITSVVNSIIAVAKKRLGIKSPSTVFQTIGREIGAGLIKGIGSMTGKAKTSGAALAGAAASGGRGVVVGGKGGKGKGAKAAKGEPKAAKADAGTGKLAGGAAKAGGAIGTLALLLSFLPGKVGEVAASLSTFIFILSLIGPALLKFGAVAGKVMLTVASVVGKAMLIIGRAMMANPWLLLIGALILVVVLVIKYWDQIKKAVVTAALFIWNWLKKNWPLILKIVLGPLGFLIVAIIKHWDKIKSVFFAAVHAVFNWLKKNWPLLLKIILGPLGWVLVAVIKNWDKIKANTLRIARALLAALKRAWAFIKAYIIDPLKAAWAWVVAKFKAFKDNFLRGVAILIQGFKDRWNKAKGIVTTAISNAIAAAKKGLKGLRDLVSLWMGKIGDAWDKFKNAAKKPINWVIRHVINNGILKAFNWVAERLPGIGTIKGTVPEIATGGPIPNVATGGQIPKNRAGGVLRGPGTGTSDSILGINYRGVATARVSNGEYVVNEKATKKNKPLLDAINSGKIDRKKMHSGPGYEKTVDFGKAMGGLVNFQNIPGLFLGGRAPIGGAWNRHGDYSFATWAGDNPTPIGTPVHAWKDGQTAQANRWNYSYGNHVRINHGGQSSLYAHLSAILTRVGEKINAGEIIGLSGSSGNSTGPHLHFEVRGGNVSQGKDTGLLSRVLSVINGPKEFAQRIGGSFKEMKSHLGSDYLSKMGAAVPKTLKKAAAAEIKKKWKAAKASIVTSGVFGAGDPGGTSGHNQQLGKKLMLAAGFGENQWPALRALWTNESGWNNHARNPSSGAYGIPQALPASKMGRAGASGNAEAQIKWGLSYIKSRYGSPSNALSAWKGRSPHWYARGTHGASPGWGVVGEKGPELMKFKGGEQVVPTQKLHSGGQVAGFKKNAKGSWVRAIREQIPYASNSQTITPALMDWFKAHNTPPVRNRADFVQDTGMLSSLASVMNKSKKNMSLQTAGDKIKRDPYWLWLHYDRMTSAGLDKDLKARKVSAGKRKALLKSAKSWGSRRTKDVKALEKQLKLTVDGTFDQEVADSVAHAMDHAAGYKVGTFGHSATDPIPWDIGAAGLPGILAEQIRTNRLNAEFDRIIETFRSWGLNALVTRFTELGPADGLTIMRDLSGNKTAATEYNAAVQVELDRAAKAEDPTEQQIVKFMEAVRAGTRVGLQGASSAAGVAIDTGVKLYDMITSQGRWGTIPTSQWSTGSRLAMDVEQFRNLFKFARGGRVPGSGHQDTVPSLLTPREYVLRAGAASAIEREQGPGALNYLNNYDKFADGGFVAAGVERPVLPAPPSSFGRARAASRADEHATKVVQYNFNTEVHNPIAEPTSVSVQKRVQRMARLGLLAGDDKESHR